MYNLYDIIIRLLIAALHFNENYGREQAKTSTGTERMGFAYRKEKHGEPTPKPIPVPKTYSTYYMFQLTNYLINKIVLQIILMIFYNRPWITVTMALINHHYQLLPLL